MVIFEYIKVFKKILFWSTKQMSLLNTVPRGFNVSELWNSHFLRKTSFFDVIWTGFEDDTSLKLNSHATSQKLSPLNALHCGKH
jgi:hypothetical protein